jgi:hypothetical protein
MEKHMKKSMAATIALLALAAQTAHAGTFANGGFELNSTDGWVTGEGTRSGQNSDLSPSQYLPGGIHYDGAATRSSLIAAGTSDPVLGDLLGSTVYQGSYSYRVEDTSSNADASAISQSVSNYTEDKIFFTWKAALENGGHEPEGSSALFITLRDDTTGTDLVSRFYDAGDGGGGVDTRFSTYGSYFYTADWQLEEITIDASRAGHDFTLSLLLVDCDYGAHAGYAYLDGFGSTVPVPEPSAYAMMLLGLAGVGYAARRRKKN